jgi:HD domain
MDLIRRAYDVAALCHQGQLRRSGDPYITHPLTVATILARLQADDQTLCAAILHDTLEDTPYTHTALSREFGPEIAAMVNGIMALDGIRGRRGRKVARAMAAVNSADTRVVATKLADRLHNMQTVRFLPQAKQLRKAREVLEIFVPVGEKFTMYTVASELETLAAATLTRHQAAGHGPLGLPRHAMSLRAPLAHHRTIVALDIERSTSRPDPVKAELRTTMYQLFDAALRAAGIHPRHRDRFADRGDGLLALIHPADCTPKVLVKRVIPALALVLAEYNATPSRLGQPQLQLRIRVVVHAGTVFYDANGCFGEALDTAFRLLDAAQVKQALEAASAALVLVASAGTLESVYPGRTNERPAHRLVSVETVGRQHQGWILAS